MIRVGDIMTNVRTLTVETVIAVVDGEVLTDYGIYLDDGRESGKQIFPVLYAGMLDHDRINAIRQSVFDIKRTLRFKNHSPNIIKAQLAKP